MPEQKNFNYAFSFTEFSKEKKQKTGRKPGRSKTLNYIEVMYTAANDHGNKSTLGLMHP